MPPFFTKPRKALKNKCLGFLASRNMKRITPCSVVPPQVSFAANIIKYLRNQTKSCECTQFGRGSPKADAEPLCHECSEAASGFHAANLPNGCTCCTYLSFHATVHPSKAGTNVMKWLAWLVATKDIWAPNARMGARQKSLEQLLQAWLHTAYHVLYHALFRVICSIYFTQFHTLFHWNSGPHGAAWMNSFIIFLDP